MYGCWILDKHYLDTCILSVDVICPLKITVAVRKLFASRNRYMSVEKYRCVFLCQLKAVVLV